MVRWERAVVEERKILEYLLATDHPIGTDKAAFFLAVGYSRQDWQRLRDDLQSLAVSGEPTTAQDNAFGTKYVVDGVVQMPIGRTVELRTVWITDGDGGDPRLVTAYPR